LELDITSIKERLGIIESRLGTQITRERVETSAEPVRPTTFTTEPISCGEWLLQRKSTYDTNEMPNIPDVPDFPLIVIRNKAFMELAGLSQILAARLATLEASAIRDISPKNDRYDSFEAAQDTRVC